MDIHNQLKSFTRQVILDNGLTRYSNILHFDALKKAINAVFIEFVRSGKIGHIIFSTGLEVVSEKYDRTINPDFELTLYLDIQSNIQR